MTRYYLMQDRQKCVQCHACEVQCKANKSLPPGPRPCQIIKVPPKRVKETSGEAYVFMSCYHCEKALCVSACPSGAMQKRDDGIVFVDQELCVGCKTCIQACPWGAPQWNPETGKVVKCDYCKDRVDQGLQPACVSVCITGCLEFGETDDMSSVKRQRFVRERAIPESE
jgi:Fe-S-cluster-containing dehydrogenase component